VNELSRMKKSKPRTRQSVEKDPHSERAAHSSSRLKIPTLLFEGDEDALPAHGIQNQPETTARLQLMARDPHSIYAHWDLPAEQKRESLVLKVHREHTGGSLAATISVARESNHAFVYVAEAGCQYVAQIGYSDGSGRWHGVATSVAVTTPQQAISFDRTTEYAQMPPAMPRYRPSSAIHHPIDTKEPAKPASIGIKPVSLVPPPSVSWTPSLPMKGEQLEETSFEKNYWRDLLASGGETTQTEMNYPTPPREESFSAEAGSIDLEQLLRTTFAQLSFGDSSFLGDAPAISPNFFLTVATELIVHGATHPNAQVSISGLPIELRPDGTFTCSFALVEGELALIVEAVSTDGDSRRVALKVLRQS